MASPSVTVCCYCGNGIQYGVSHKLCTECRLQFCLNCQSSHPTAHTYSTYAMTAVPSSTDEFRPRACTACAKLSHSHVSCQQNGCAYLLCTDCFDNSMDERLMHEHDELRMVYLPHRQCLDKVAPRCSQCSDKKSFSHCTNCLIGIQPSDVFFSCTDCIRIFDDISSTVNLCQPCMTAVRVRPESLNHRFASFMFVISGEDEEWSVTCNQCHLTLPNLESNFVSRHGHNSWTIAMGKKFAETYPQLAVRTCARTAAGLATVSQYSYPSPVPSPSGQTGVAATSAPGIASGPDATRGIPSQASRSDVPSPYSTQPAPATAAQYAPAVSQPQSVPMSATTTSSSSPDPLSHVAQSFQRMSISHPQTPASPGSIQQGLPQRGVYPGGQSQPQVGTPQPTSPPLGYPQQQPMTTGASGYPQQVTSRSPQQPQQVAYAGGNQVMYQPRPTSGQTMMHQQQPQAAQQAQPNMQMQLQQQQAQQQQQRQLGQQAQPTVQMAAPQQGGTQVVAGSMRPHPVHANTAPVGAVRQMQMAPMLQQQQQQQQVVYTNAHGQLVQGVPQPQLVQAQPAMQAQPQQYMLQQQVINGQLMTVKVPVPQAVPQPGMLQHAHSFPAQVVHAQPQAQVAMVPVRSNGQTVYVPQSSIHIVNGVAQVKPGVLPAAGAGRGRGAAAPQMSAANVKAHAETNKFMQDLAKVAVGSLVKGVVRGAMN